MARLEKYIIEQGAPTLASLKTGTLFCVDTTEPGELLRQIGLWNSRLRDKGVSITLLRYNGHRALVYMYRHSQLRRDLETAGAVELLAQCGYASAEPGYAIERLRERFCESAEFPHEIGVFLGYPLGDVEGFIANRGQNFTCCGCWKSYGDPDAARRHFAQLDKCTAVYLRLFHSGTPVLKLTVAA